MLFFLTKGASGIHKEKNIGKKLAFHSCNKKIKFREKTKKYEITSISLPRHCTKSY